MASVCLETFIKCCRAITDAFVSHSGAFPNQRKCVANAEQTPQDVVTQKVREESASWSQSHLSSGLKFHFIIQK